MVPDEAVSAFEEGVRHHLAGRPDAARESYAIALTEDPGNPSILHRLGVIALETGQPRSAADLLTKAIRLLPEFAGLHSDLGNALYMLGNMSGAEKSLRRATDLDPDLMPAFCNLGAILKAAGKYGEAEDCFNRAIELDSAVAEAHSNLGGILVEQGRYEDAVKSCKRAIELRADFAEAYINLAAALKAALDLEGAKVAAAKALEISPNSVEALINAGSIELDLGRLDPAARAMNRALELNPASADAHYNLGNIFYAQGHVERSKNEFRRAIEISPSFADAHLGLGRIHLNEGALSDFWSVYAMRWQSKNYQSFRRSFPQPVWDGKSLKDKAILIWGEQGIGDEIFFAGLIPEIASEAAVCVVETEPRLVTLFARSFSGIEVVPRTLPPNPRTLAPDLQLQAPMGDLPRWLRPSLAGFRSLGAYLKADPKLASEFHRRYESLGSGLKIGISWSSKVPKLAPLDQWAPIFEIPDIRFISLQYGDRGDEISEIEKSLGIRIFDDDSVDPLTDMDRFASQVDAMDAVVTIDNSTLSVAVALGKTTFAMIPRTADWRYFDGEAGNPWHDSLRQFRQEKFGDWSEVVIRIAEELRTLARGDNLRGSDPASIPPAP